MKVTVLGCWAPYPRAGGACSGYLLEGEKNILIDCGHGVMGSLQRHINFRKLDAVIISHLHPDHYMDIFCLRHAIEGAIRDGSLDKPVPLFLPASPIEAFTQISLLKGAFDVSVISEETPLLIEGMRITFLKTQHALETYALRIEQGDKVFGYTADTGLMPELKGFFTGSSLLISEASLFEKDKAKATVGHLTAKEAAKLGLEAQVKKLLLTHFWPEYEPQELLREANCVNEEVRLVEEGKVYSID